MAPIPPKSPNEVWNDYVSPIRPTETEVIEKGTDLHVPNLKYYNIKYNDTVGLQYTLEIYGDQPLSGYPIFISLHGGGSGDRTENDKEWSVMATGFYRNNVQEYVKQGVYIAARGLTRKDQQDTWNLHFNSESYFLFQKLIRNLLFKKPLEAKDAKDGQLNANAVHFADPNRVYILGFSAGGDGVYRLATVLSDRFAAASMCAGHPGGSVLSNLANVPICLQVGQWDGDENPEREASRNVVTAQTAMELRRLQSYDHGYYIYDMFLHPTTFHLRDDNNRSHNSWEADHLTTAPRRVIREWDQIRLWHDEKMRIATDDKLVLELKNTCAVDWVSQRNRNPLPRFVTWDVSPRKADEPEPILPTEWAGYRFSYWLAVKTATAQEKFTALKNSGTTDPNLVIRAFCNPARNVVWIQQTPIPVIILLNDHIIQDFTKPITILYGWLRERSLQVTVAQDYLVQSRTLYARGDPEFIFSATILFDPVSKTATDGGSQVFPENSKS